MNIMAEISVIVPVYNAGALLEPCIESVLAQSFTDWELLLVDDASTDSSAAVCRRYAASDSRIRALAMPRNSGPSAARNLGIDCAKGSYIAFLDSDDRFAPSFLERLKQIILTTGCEIAAAPMMRTSKEKSAIKEEYPASGQLIVSDATTAIADTLYQKRNNPSVSGKLFKKSIFADERFRDGRFEDLDLFYRLFLLAGRIAWTPTPLYLYTINPASYMQNFTPERAVVLDVVERMIAFMEQNHPALLPAARDRALSAAFNIFVLLNRHGCDEPEIKRRCREIILRYRRESLLNPRVRLKNKLAVIATYLGGFRLIAWAARIAK